MIYTYDINVFFLNIKKLTSKHVCSIIKIYSIYQKIFLSEYWYPPIHLDNWNSIVFYYSILIYKVYLIANIQFFLFFKLK